VSFSQKDVVWLTGNVITSNRVFFFFFGNGPNLFLVRAYMCVCTRAHMAKINMIMSGYVSVGFQNTDSCPLSVAVCVCGGMYMCCNALCVFVSGLRVCSERDADSPCSSGGWWDLTSEEKTKAQARCSHTLHLHLPYRFTL